MKLFIFLGFLEFSSGIYLGFYLDWCFMFSFACLLWLVFSVDLESLFQFSRYSFSSVLLLQRCCRHM